MTIEEAKNMKLADYLHSLGYSPVKQQGNNLWYKSPLRKETESSFKVNLDRNLWHDFGTGKGGNIIALAQELYQSDHVSYLLERIAEQSPHIRPISFSFGKQSSHDPNFQQMEVMSLSSPALFAYLQERGINIELAKRECMEIHFVNNGKPYFTVGFPNASGGHEIRNKYFKGCISPKDITHIRQAGEPRDTCFVFEGFMDYLSFLTIRKQRSPEYPYLDAQDYLILNSTSNLSKALCPLGSYERIHCLLDNDDAGRKAVEAISSEYGLRVRDASQLYSEYKDLNDYLCNRPMTQQPNVTTAQRCNKDTLQHTKQEHKVTLQSTKQQSLPIKRKGRGFRM